MKLKCLTVMFSTVHYASMHGSGINGIIEFMDPKFRRKFHSFKSDNPATWEKSNKVVKIPCLPLSLIFEYVPIHHINYLSLDVEGAELTVLRSINFDSVKFDIISVEIEKPFRPSTHESDITQLLHEKGYIKIWCSGRNAWFRHNEYEIKSRDVATPPGNCEE